MRGALSLAILLIATTVAAQPPRKKACDFLSAADVQAALGESNLVPREVSISNGTGCLFEKVVGYAKLTLFKVFVTYTASPDTEAVLKWQKSNETTTFDHADAVLGIGDAAFYAEPFGNPSVPKHLTIFVGGIMTLTIGDGTTQQLRALAQRALGDNGATGFAYTGAVPTTAKPTLPAPNRTPPSSPLEQLKTALTKKADAGDGRAEEALAGLSRYPTGGARPDYAAALYWYKRASDHGVTRASYELGTMYSDGVGTRVNNDAAKELFTKAANAGYVPAMMPLALIYAASPDFVSKRRASEWALKAAAGNDPEGHLTTGYLWDKGQLSFDESESGRNALAEYRKAADLGNCVAMMNIGGLYFNGSHRMKQDASQAEQWFGRAETCLRNGVKEMQQTAARYRSLAAAGHLPVPEAPPPPATGSRFFKRPGSRDQQDEALAKMCVDMLQLGALSAAYFIAHPEEAARLPSAPAGGKDVADIVNSMDRQQHYAEMQHRIFSGGCNPPTVCWTP